MHGTCASTCMGVATSSPASWSASCRTGSCRGTDTFGAIGMMPSRAACRRIIMSTMSTGLVMPLKLRVWVERRWDLVTPVRHYLRRAASISRTGVLLNYGTRYLPTAAGELSQSSPCFALCCGVALRRGTHDALPWTRTDSCGPSCPFVPLSTSAPLDPHHSSDLEDCSIVQGVRWGTTQRARKPEIRVSEHPHSHVEGGRVPPTCLSEWVFLFISVRLCLSAGSTKNAPDLRKIADQGRDQVFT